MKDTQLSMFEPPPPGDLANELDRQYADCMRSWGMTPEEIAQQIEADPLDSPPVEAADSPAGDAADRQPSAFELRRQRRIERLEQAADRAERESQARYKAADDRLSVIPFGQPIHGAADRRYREKAFHQMEKAHELHVDAQEYARRAEAAARNRAIFSDDPDAAEKLESKISRLQKRQEMMKAANKLIRKGDRAGLLEMGFGETTIEKLFLPDFAGRIGFPDYEITNNGANIRRLAQRLAHIEAHKDDETTESTHGEIRIVDNVEENRLQIFFPGKPADQVRQDLHHSGFKWSRYNGCWQRQRGNNATYDANRIVKKYYPQEEV